MGPFFPLARFWLRTEATPQPAQSCRCRPSVCSLPVLLSGRAAGSASDHRHSLTRVPRTAFRSPLPVFFSSQRGSCPGPGLPCICCSVTAPASAVDLPMYSSVAAVSAPASVLLPFWQQWSLPPTPVRRRPGPPSPRLPPVPERAPALPSPTSEAVEDDQLPTAVSLLRKRSGCWRLRRLLRLRLPT